MAITAAGNGQTNLANTIAKGSAAAKAASAPGGIPSLSDWLNSDGTYLDTANSIQKNLGLANADITQQKADYATNRANDLRQLGWNGSSWNTVDPNTSSGRAFGSELSDFGNRGMLSSSGYSDAVTNTGRSFDQQKTNSDLAAQKFNNDLTAYGATENQQANDAIAQAKREAIARRSLKYSTMATGVLN